MKREIFEYNGNYNIKCRDSFVKLTGLFLCFFILLLLTACGSKDVVYELSGEDDKRTMGEDNTEENTVPGDGVDIGKEQEEKKPEYIIVHLCGAVMKPGVYELEEGSRVADGIELAGGFVEGASQEALNLASRLMDGEQIYVPTCEEIDTGEYIPANNTNSSDNPPSNAKEVKKGININTASMEELMTLPGIGPSRAEEIISYREKTPFAAIEDICNVSGIGEASFNKLKDKIYVEE